MLSQDFVDGGRIQDEGDERKRQFISGLSCREGKS